MLHYKRDLLKLKFQNERNQKMRITMQKWPVKRAIIMLIMVFLIIPIYYLPANGSEECNHEWDYIEWGHIRKKIDDEYHETRYECTKCLATKIEKEKHKWRHYETKIVSVK